MRKSKFTDSQIMDAVKRVEAGFAVPSQMPSIAQARKLGKRGATARLAELESQ